MVEWRADLTLVTVYHLSAQFPGPTAPRDFVELLLTSSAALSKPDSGDSPPESAEDLKAAAFDGVPRHFMVISKPCKHPACPPRSGFVRGDYESIEFIREVPHRSKRSSSTTDLTKMRRQYGHGVPINKEATLRHARQKSGSFEASFPGESEVQSDTDEKPQNSGSLRTTEQTDGRIRGKTISFAESRGRTAKGEAVDLQSDESDDEAKEMNPVEWTMITRSDPGGSVPRFMVERGTPSSIVADASKFLNWACKKQLSSSQEELLHAKDSEAMEARDINTVDNRQSDDQVPHLDGSADRVDTSSQSLPKSESSQGVDKATSAASTSILSNITNAASTTIGAYTPQSILDRLPAQQRPLSPPLSFQNSATPTKAKTEDSDSASTFSSASFASADSHLSSPSTRSTPLSATSSATKSKQPVSPRDKEVAKMAASKAKLDEKLRKTREKETKDKEELTSKEEARLQKAEEKHAREVKKVEERFEKEMRVLEEKRRKEEEKERRRREAEAEKERKKREAEEEVERKRREKEEKESVEKVKEVMEGKLEALKNEMRLLEERAGRLQSENTALVAALGKIEGGEAVLEAVRKEIG